MSNGSGIEVVLTASCLVPKNFTSASFWSFFNFSYKLQSCCDFEPSNAFFLQWSWDISWLCDTGKRWRDFIKPFLEFSINFSYFNIPPPHLHFCFRITWCHPSLHPWSIAHATHGFTGSSTDVLWSILWGLPFQVPVSHLCRSSRRLPALLLSFIYLWSCAYECVGEGINPFLELSRWEERLKEEKVHVRRFAYEIRTAARFLTARFFIGVNILLHNHKVKGRFKLYYLMKNRSIWKCKNFSLCFISPFLPSWTERTQRTLASLKLEIWGTLVQKHTVPF